MQYADAQQAAGLAMALGWVLVAVVLCARQAGLVTLGPALHHGLRLPGPVLWGSGAAVALYAAQSVVVDAVEDAPNRVTVLDRPVLDWMVAHRSPGLTAAMEAVSRWGGTNGTLLLAGAAVVVLLVARRAADAAAVAVATAGVAVLVPLFKDVYGRSRPPVATRLAVEPDASLPSGHALGALVIVGIVAVVLVPALRAAWLRVAVVAAAAAVVLTISLSRLYLGVHWATDVLTSWTLGGAWLAAVVTAWWWAAVRTPRRPAAPGRPAARTRSPQG
ncbi:phosphatase PAP2 family protein [Pseudonocardia spirodelae]|uniref:Phosphatase PAP2 family protein n=1 Tax=Pseudonocardia spirodelae TaxID=3133431 RepID=A0ABU8T2H2_9PSEU